MWPFVSNECVCFHTCGCEMCSHCVWLGWTLWDVAILHGDAPFCLHWAYRLRISLFSKTNPGWVFLKTPFYTTVLAAVFCLGLANAMKRTTVAMHFGRRTFGT